MLLNTEGAKDVLFHVLYRPPNLSNSRFLDEFGIFLEGTALSGCENILLGDLNFHVDQHDTWTLKFYDILEQFSFTQLVNTPTHIQGDILDALCVRDSFSWAISPKVIGGLSDHQAIMFSLIFPIRESCKFQRVSMRRIPKINILDFRMDILKSDLIRCQHKTASLLSHQYFNTLRSLLDKYAPIKKKNIPRHAETGFMNCDILKASNSRGHMCEHSTMKTQPAIIANTQLQSITIISCLRRPNAIIIPTLWLKIKEILSLCGTVSKRFYTGPLLLFCQTAQIKLTLQTLSVRSSMTKSLK